MAKIGGTVFTTPAQLVTLGSPLSQQVAIAATHQLEAGADESYGLVA
jgi:hypothetical protein